MQTELDTRETNQKVLVILLNKIIELLGTKEDEIEDISINNLDEIRASLRNELSVVVKSINNIPDNKDVVKELKLLADAIKKIELSPSINVDAAQVTVPDIKIPDINVPTPQVTVNVPDVIVPEINVPQAIVNIPAPIVNIPEVNLEEVIKELHVGLEKLRTNNKSRPLAVRLTDGGDWIKELRSINESQGKQVQFMSDVSYLRDVSGQRINPATAEGQSFLLVPKQFDYIHLDPPSQPTTITYKIGGASGTTVAVLTLTYSGTDVATVTRT